MKTIRTAFVGVVVTMATGWSNAAGLPSNLTQKGERIYEVKDGVIQYSKPSFKFQGERLYEMQPGTNTIRYDKPSYTIKGDRMYEMEPGTNTIRYDKPSYEMK